MTRTLKTEAIVLKKRSMPNGDQIITLFTQELGKMAVFAKGIKKITSRRLPHSQTSNLIIVQLSHKNERYYLQETSLISGFSKIKNDEVKVKHLYTFFFVLERMLPEHQKEDDVYDLTKRFLISLSKDDFDQKKLTEFMNKLLIIMGFSTDPLSQFELAPFIEDIIHEKIPSIVL